MPPKRKAPASKKNGNTGAKKGKKSGPQTEAVSAVSTTQDHIRVLKAADKGKSKTHKVDTFCPGSSNYTVYADYDAMLNQTNIGQNNNKFYVIQVLQDRMGRYFTWNRWGRVGEQGQNALKGPMTDSSIAVKDFEKKFADKTKNKWADHEKFVAKPGKYTLIEMAGDDEEDFVDAAVTSKIADPNQKIAKSKLDSATQSLIKLIFDNDMFRDAMKNFEIDVKKMPLGKLSKPQIAKGFEILEELEDAIKRKSPKSRLQELSSKFYTAIPHDFGRKVPPVIDEAEALQKKYDMLGVLGDIEIAQSMQKDKDKDTEDKEEIPHPLDMNYELLKCKLVPLNPQSNDYKVIQSYFQATKPNNTWQKLQLKQIWTVDREGEVNRFKEHDKIKERKLLWHGTNVAVVAAILKTGLRIMPHSGGRVGRGIYFASENDKSAGYVQCAGKQGIMFLNEVAIGKQHCIYQDDPSLTEPPKGSDSVLAVGQKEPDPAKDTTLTLDGHTVIVPQGKPMPTGHSRSSFYQSEYLIYKESQNRIRYLLLLDFN